MWVVRSKALLQGESMGTGAWPSAEAAQHKMKTCPCLSNLKQECDGFIAVLVPKLEEQWIS